MGGYAGCRTLNHTQLYNDDGNDEYRSTSTPIAKCSSDRKNGAVLATELRDILSYSLSRDL